MSKRTSVAGELITKDMLDSFLQNLKGEPLYGKVVAKTDNYNMATDTDTFLVVTAFQSAKAVTLPPATGSGRIIAMVASDVTGATTLVRAGTNTIGAAGTTLTFTPAWEYAMVVDVAVGKWAVLAATAALT